LRICSADDDPRHLVDLGAIGATVDWPARALEIVSSSSGRT
jgi:hypothetical protein